MENSFSSNSRVFDPKNPWKFCTDLDIKYHRNCARYQSQIFLGKIGQSNPLDLVGKYCAMGLSTLLRETCFESLGFYIAQNNLGKEEGIWKACSSMPDKNGLEICLMGGAIETTFQKYGGFEKSGPNICNKITESRKSECLNNIKNMVR